LRGQSLTNGVASLGWMRSYGQIYDLKDDIIFDVRRGFSK
jgi:hypothetical protein